MLCTATRDISSSNENINSTTRVFRLSFRSYDYSYMHTFVQRFLSSDWEALQGIVTEHFVFLCFSTSQKTMEIILGNVFSSVLEGHNFDFFSLLIAHHGGPSVITKYVTSGMPKKSLGTALIELSPYKGWVILDIELHEVQSSFIHLVSFWKIASKPFNTWLWLKENCLSKKCVSLSE